jgi:DNA-binding HxlR family transcriptional regulator
MLINKDCLPSGAAIKDTGFGYTLSIIGGKHKMIILYCIAQWDNILRFNQLHRIMKNISYKSLALSLKEMEADGLILRKEYPQIPPKVEYSLTEKGIYLIPIMEAMCDWGKKNKPHQVQA